MAIARLTRYIWDETFLFSAAERSCVLNFCDRNCQTSSRLVVVTQAYLVENFGVRVQCRVDGFQVVIQLVQRAFQRTLELRKR